jgi:uridine phosphorylase
MAIIKETDLILKEGAVYHLGLRPEQLADKIITVGDPGRVAAISKYFDMIETSAEHREFITHTGTFQGKRISVISTGMGTDNKQTRSLEIVRVGTSGSLKASVPVNSIVVSAMGIGLDTLMCFYNFPQSRQDKMLASELQDHISLPFAPYITYANSDLLQNVGDGMIRGITLTCPGFYAPQGRTVRLSPKQGDLLSQFISFQHGQISLTNFEMETAGYYAMASLLGHKMLSVNVIVANRVSDVFSKRPEVAMKKAIESVLERI